jgi:hypothetical protein
MTIRLEGVGHKAETIRAGDAASSIEMLRAMWAVDWKNMRETPPRQWLAEPSGKLGKVSRWKNPRETPLRSWYLGESRSGGPPGQW